MRRLFVLTISKDWQFLSRSLSPALLLSLSLVLLTHSLISLTHSHCFALSLSLSLANIFPLLLVSPWKMSVWPTTILRQATIKQTYAYYAKWIQPHTYTNTHKQKNTHTQALSEKAKDNISLLNVHVHPHTHTVFHTHSLTQTLIGEKFTQVTSGLRCCIYSVENKYLNPCRFRKFGHLQRNVWSIIVMVGVF